jgi:hypothetical protein
MRPCRIASGVRNSCATSREQRHEGARAGRGEDDQGRERAADAAHDQRGSVMAAPGAVLVPVWPHAPVNL